MQDQHIELPSRRLLIAVVIALLLALSSGFIITSYLGTFTTVTAQQVNAPAYRIAYLNHTGAYNKIDATIKRVAAYLKEANITASSACALFYDDPSVVPMEELRSKVGFLVTPYDTVPPALEIEEIPQREVVRVLFDGSTLIGSNKAYKAMKQWSVDHAYNLVLPSFEIYHEDNRTEYQLPIHKLP